MTEAEWLAIRNPATMLHLVGNGRYRKLRLFVCAECRRQESNILKSDFRDALEVAERYVDGMATEDERSGARFLTSFGAHCRRTNRAQSHAQRLVTWLTQRNESMTGSASLALSDKPNVRLWQAQIIRDIFGNPSRPTPYLLPAVLAWNDATVRRIAEGIYEGRAFERLPILADALLDAGCDNEELIAHCRSAGPHVRGCWAVDLILGKS
jgi:hypothetical protein